MVFLLLISLTFIALGKDEIVNTGCNKLIFYMNYFYLWIF